MIATVFFLTGSWWITACAFAVGYLLAQLVIWAVKKR